MDKLTALSHCFGHTAFREGQEALIDAILSGRDALGIMPTGGGKSICYQLPALLLGGVTVVISPLISLMRDQVLALTAAGIPAAAIHSAQTPDERAETLRSLRAGRCRIVYVAPERLDTEGFAALAASLTIPLVAVDEAHCISQWGQDFRPSYLHITEFLEKLPRRPVVAAFTATATEQVRGDIISALALRSPLCVTTGFDRPNLNFEVLRPQSKLAALKKLVAARPGQCGIVYCATRAAVESVCAALQSAGVAATRYHAGLPGDERHANQEDFLCDRALVCVATNAFGMGIDKSNVSFVIHYNMPKSIEAYYQEAGRAGRDGAPADCILLYSAGDVQTAKFLIESSAESSDLPEDEREAVLRGDYARLAAMAAYCKQTGCLRGYLLGYFGQAHPDRCGSCGNCRAAGSMADRTSEAQMILSCVRRVRDHLGYNVGAALIAAVLCGSRDKRVRELGLSSVSTYGLLKATPRAAVREYIDQLESLGYLHADPVYGTLELTASAGGVLFRGERVSLRSPAPAQARESARLAPAGENPELFERLRALRAQLAQRENVPAYIVFSNAALADMAARAPKTEAEFLAVSGVGEAKAGRYGAQFLDEIRRWRSDPRA